VNILITTGIYPPDVGGPARFVPLIAEKLSNKNNVKVITLSQDLSGLDNTDYQVIRILRRQSKFIRFFKTVFLIIKFGGKSDVIFINGLWLETYLANLFIRKKTIRKIVGDPVWEKYYTKYKVTEEFDEFQSKKFNISIELYKFLRNVSIKSVNTIIVPSNHLSNFIKNIGFSGNLMQINNGTKKSTDIEKIYDENNFLIVSRLVRHKNIDLIIKSFNDLKKRDSLDFKLNIIGEGPEYKKINNLIEKFNLSDSITLVGSKFGNELEEYYKNSNYFLQISSYEGMPHSILEAMNHKLIVIASKFGGNYELIRNNDFGYIVESIQEDNIIDSIKKAINDSRNKIIASKGKNLVNQKYNIELTTQKYAEVIFKNE